MSSARRRTAAVGGALALVGAVGVGGAAAASTEPAPASATPSNVPPPVASPPVASPVASAPVASLVPSPVPPQAVSSTSASVAAPALAAVGHVASRLALTVTPGRTLTVVGVLTRAADGTPAVRRRIEVYARTADTGRWRLLTSARTSSGGRIVVRTPDRPLLQLTLRFEGDRRYTAAASVTLVPDPSATALRPEMVRALARARAAAKRAGLTLVLNSGYRSFAKQERMYRAAVRQYGSARIARRWVLPPQESTHVRGLAADVGTPATAAWLGRHGAAFGLCRAYGDEPWHFEYRPDWIKAFGGRCPAPVPLPGDPDPLSPAPRVAVRF